MGKGNFFTNIWNTIEKSLTNFWGFVVDYWNEFLNDPGEFIENHVFVFLAAIFLLILIIVLIINGFNNISDKKKAKRKLLEEYNAPGPKSIEEVVSKMEEEAAVSEEVPLVEEPIEEKVEVEVTEDTPIENVDVVVEEENIEAISHEEEKEEINEDTPLPSVINAEEEKVIPIVEENVFRNETVEDVKEEIVEVSENTINSYDDLPQYEFVADVKIVTPKEKEGIAKVRIEPEEPITFNATSEEEIVFCKEEKKHSFVFEDEDLDLDFDFDNFNKEEKKNPILFDPIPELKSLERDDINGYDETLFEEEPETEVIKESEPIISSKIEVVKVNPTKKFGNDNTDTNRQGKTFTYDELFKIIKD